MPLPRAIARCLAWPATRCLPTWCYLKADSCPCQSLPPAALPPAQAEAAARLPSFYAEDTPASANEVWQRLHADPLFAIKQQEQAARRSIVANPVKMQAIKSQVGGHWTEAFAVLYGTSSCMGGGLFPSPLGSW